MSSFIQKHASAVTGTLTGFDRLVLRGQLPISYADAMDKCLRIEGVLLKDFTTFASAKRDALVAATEEFAKARGRPSLFLASSATDKAELAESIAARDGVKAGLICVLKSVEPCRQFDFKKNPKTGHIELFMREGKCAFLYHYAVHPLFGPMSARIQTFLPFTVQVYLNGREWLARQLNAEGIGCEKHDNTFVSVQDPARAQALLDLQSTINWKQELEQIAHCLLPGYPHVFERFEVRYDWTVHQSEVATDVMFKDPAHLKRIYPSLTREAIASFDSGDVIRFLGQNRVGARGIRENFTGEVLSNFRRRREGVRVKHFVDTNSIKMYDKADGHVLRVETTINAPYDFRVVRAAKGGGPETVKRRVLRKSVDDVARRVDVSAQANARYLEKLAAFDCPTTLYEILDPLTRPTQLGKARVRALRFCDPTDLPLLQAVSRGEFVVNGFRNVDVRKLVFAEADDKALLRRLSGQVTRWLRLLRAHGLVERLPRSHRYQLTPRGQLVTAAVLAAVRADVKKLAATA